MLQKHLHRGTANDTNKNVACARECRWWCGEQQRKSYKRKITNTKYLVHRKTTMHQHQTKCCMYIMYLHTYIYYRYIRVYSIHKINFITAARAAASKPIVSTAAAACKTLNPLMCARARALPSIPSRRCTCAPHSTTTQCTQCKIIAHVSRRPHMLLYIYD